VAAALLVAVPIVLHRGAPSLAARAYAATAPGDEIIHEVTLRTLPTGDSGPITEELWARPADGTARSVQTSGGRRIAESTVDARGVERIVTADGHGTTVAPRSPDRERSVTQWFRHEYATRSLHDDGMTTFAGHRVHAYSTDIDASQAEIRHAGATPLPAHETFYIDAETALPVGVRSVERNPVTGRADVFDTVIETYERLPATPVNLAKLR
jgi:hypothetical protein